MAELTATRAEPVPVRASEPRAGNGRRWAGMLVVAVLTVPLVLVASGGRPAPGIAGLPDPGALTGWGLPAVRAVMELSAVATMGACLLAGFLAPTRGYLLERPGLRALRGAGRTAWVWAGSSLALAVLTTSDSVGVPVSRVAGSVAFLRFGLQLPEARALVMMSLVALLLALNLSTVRTRPGAVVGTLACGAALVPLLQAGHSAVAGDHFEATQGLMVHVLAATIWVGGLLALLGPVRRDRAVLAVAVRRFSALALVCFAAVGLSGLLTAWTRIGWDVSGWRSAYGALVLAKVAALLLLGLAGLVHRRYAVPRVVAGAPWAFARLATVELGLMAATVAVAVVLGRTSPPAGGGLEVGSAHGGRFPTVDRELAPLDLSQLLTATRPDAVAVTAVALAAIGYLLAVRTLRGRGETWPAGRTMCAMAGSALVLYVLCGGLGAYSAAMLSMQVTQLLAMLVTVPALVVLAQPVRLVRTVLRVPDDRGGRVQRVFCDPVNAMLLVTALLVGVYATPLLDASLRTPWVHLLVNGAALVVGVLVLGPVLGSDWLPRVPAVRERALVLAASGALLVLLAGVAWRAESGYGSEYFEDLNLWWGDPAADLPRAALVAVAYGLPLLGAALLLARNPMPRAGTEKRH
ncbi:MAG TPA: cytochrome c oxidase assembly protein [Nocardioidaceae bacterium]|nr:cytochrome c oxidase assembly protein [Nocardioidaceae bacterium]